MSFKDFVEIIIYSILAIFGATARELRYQSIKHLEIAKLISSMVVAVFGAMITYFVSSMTNMPMQMGYILAGLVGWGGPQVLDKIFEKNSGFYNEKQNDENKTNDNTK